VSDSGFSRDVTTESDSSPDHAKKKKRTHLKVSKGGVSEKVVQRGKKHRKKRVHEAPAIPREAPPAPRGGPAGGLDSEPELELGGESR
jgi:hypothetical protein